MAAIVVGEESTSIDPAVSEWRNPLNFIVEYIYPKSSDLSELLRYLRVPPELKHLSRERNIN